MRDYLHVVDLADAHLKALNALNQRESGFICNLGTGTGSSVMEVIAAFEKATGKKIPYEIVDRRPGDVTEAWANPSYAEKILGWKTVQAWRRCLQMPGGGKAKTPMDIVNLEASRKAEGIFLPAKSPH